MLRVILVSANSEVCEQVSFKVFCHLELSALDRGWDWFHPHLLWASAW